MRLRDKAIKPQPNPTDINSSPALVSVPLIYTDYAEYAGGQDITALEELIDTHHLPISLRCQTTQDKLTQKYREHLSCTYDEPVFILTHKGELSLLIDGLSIAPNWQGLQRRIVRAGRKSELLLQACKLTDQSHALDATAGFGHDSLILASTGAKVTMLERNPLLALLLIAEQAKMAQHKNWQKLMARLTIYCTDSVSYMSQLALADRKSTHRKPINNLGNNSHSNSNLNNNKSCFDVVYLDPMFPEDSYSNAKTGKGAKVGKHMQALHQVTIPPTIDEEKSLLTQAMNATNNSGRVVVKRPVSAPHLANQPPDETWRNDVVRFDGYFSNT